ncbi:hypothetical protein GPECTOR_63g43 [Gonium pectorale]|uniref:monoamine oxidase n=1 Tax=Gonium pectorale TaxID=33097 RepID=A0A150G4D3_GONPE|nr:hypothetical protein GPECTOR_63g43 [Gonium pectorale]|eukprot:KXZ44717.1 hypothetical protein GPECTOR_63g43 [Gonium pectorale]
MQHATLQLINELGLRVVKQPWFAEESGMDGEANFSSGSSVPLSEAENRELTAVCERLEGWAASVRNPQSWTACRDAVDWDGQSVQQYLDLNVASTAVRRELELLVRTTTASEPSDMSFLYFLYFLGICGGVAGVGDGDGGAQTYKICGGAQQLSTRLAAELAARGVPVRLNSAVARITRKPDGAVWVDTRAGAQLEAACLVAALSPPLWRSIEWSPPLSAAKQAIADRMYMGSVVKVIALYDTNFWEPFRPRGLLEQLGPVSNLFPSSVGGAPALIGLVVGTDARAFAALPEAERRRRVLAQYAAYFGDGAAERGCVRFMSKDWTGEAYSRGGYAALMPPGLATSAGAAFRQPEGTVVFAGTELARRWAGYFEGAVESGYRAAYDAAELLRLRQGTGVEATRAAGGSMMGREGGQACAARSKL